MQVIELLSLCVGVVPKVMCVARESRKHISQRDPRAFESQHNLITSSHTNSDKSV